MAKLTRLPNNPFAVQRASQRDCLLLPLGEGRDEGIKKKIPLIQPSSTGEPLRPLFSARGYFE